MQTRVLESKFTPDFSTPEMMLSSAVQLEQEGVSYITPTSSEDDELDHLAKILVEAYLKQKANEHIAEQHH